MNKKKIKIIISILFILIIIGFNIKKEYKFNKYAEINIDNNSHDFRFINKRDTVMCYFCLKNVSKNPFFIIEILNDNKDVLINSEKIKKIINPNQEINIELKYIAKEKGKFYRNIFIVSNSSLGKIKLDIKGIVK